MGGQENRTVVASMTKRERLAAALRGEVVDRPPIAFWGHYPSDPRSAEDLARAAIAFQQKYDWDFVKIMATGAYHVEILGAETRYDAFPYGYPRPVCSPIQTGGDWEKLSRLEWEKTYLQELVKACDLVHRAMPDVPCIQTIFSPLSTADWLALNNSLAHHVRNFPEQLHAGLELVTEFTASFARRCLEAGADGVFFAVRNATRGQLTDEEYLEFGKPYDLRVLNGLRGAFFNLLHVCKTNIMVDVVSDYPAHAISWDSETGYPSLREARTCWPRYCLAAGIDRASVIPRGCPEDVRLAVGSAIRQSGGDRFILAPTCGLRLPHVEENLYAARQAVGQSKIGRS